MAQRFYSGESPGDTDEGTWTPTLLNGGTTTFSNVPYYKKVGNMVHVSFYANTITGIPNDAKGFQIGGLPYTVRSHVEVNFGFGGQIQYSFSNSFDWSKWEPLIHGQLEYIYFHQLGASSHIQLANSQVTGLITHLIMNISYITDEA